MKPKSRRTRDDYEDIKGDREMISVCLERCALDEIDIEILRRKCLHQDSLVKISSELNMSYSNVSRRYCEALHILVKVAKRCRKQSEI